MGKNRDIKSVVVSLVNTVVHEIVARHTNKPESKLFLEAEVAEYRSQTEKAVEKYNWNQWDKNHIREEAIKEINKILSSKYPDVSFQENEVKLIVDKEISNLEISVKK